MSWHTQFSMTSGERFTHHCSLVLNMGGSWKHYGIVNGILATSIFLQTTTGERLLLANLPTPPPSPLPPMWRPLIFATDHLCMAPAASSPRESSVSLPSCFHHQQYPRKPMFYAPPWAEQHSSFHDKLDVGQMESSKRATYAIRALTIHFGTSLGRCASSFRFNLACTEVADDEDNRRGKRRRTSWEMHQTRIRPRWLLRV
ncbi:hypothetical protein BKA70DRAFT_1573180 [Coprinopsis sp. MPI-PUGE-AT-0042]|nr:hypothetical protein BKA70DRAFT_1573180 [Coprinopsis sp. MPI-PUGE-AT-0042]